MGLLFEAELPDCERDLELLARNLKNAQAAQQQVLVQNVRDRYGASLLRPGPVDPRVVRPVLVPCRDRNAFQLLSFCRALQGVPSSTLVGRRLGFLVLDQGPPARLIGGFALNSSAYSMRDRDDYLHWRGPQGRNRKNQGLQCAMDMPLCMALPPYASLLGGKLVAALVLTNEVNREYMARYEGRLPPGGSLLGVVTLCATGVHCPVFNRIMFTPGGLYRRIGRTLGFSTALFSPRSLDLARGLFRGRGLRLRPPLFAKSLRIIKRALELCDLAPEALLRLGIRKGIYFGVADRSALEMLRTGEFASVRRPSVEDIAVYWRGLAERRLNSPAAPRAVSLGG